MKNILLILLLTVTLISCDNTVEPIHEEDDNYIKQFEKVNTIGDTIIAYKESNTLYFKDNNNLYYYADIQSNTANISVSLFYFIFSMVLICFIVFFLFTMLFEL